MKRLAIEKLAVFLLIVTASSGAPHAQQQTEEQPANAGPAIEAAPSAESDETIRRRIADIYAQIAALEHVDVTVQDGVITLSGQVSNEAQAQRALGIANRLEGSVTVEDNIERVLDVEGNVIPVLDRYAVDLARWLRAWPLLLVSALIFAVVAYAGHRLAKWGALWRRVAPNYFLAELVAQAVRSISIVLGLVMALNLLGASTLTGTILGGAGVIGLTVGFAVRDTMENYISSIMLSLRQPFRANDHVRINEHEGQVVRLTSRATILMTLDGNHLRIPNSTVYKAVILNYTRNPERRFEFDLGIDADDDPLAAMTTGLNAIIGLEHVIDDPKPTAVIKTVGDSNIVITFMAWMDQTKSDFGRVRSLAIQVAKIALEDGGFTLPEPLYRVRLDERGRGLTPPQAAPEIEDSGVGPADRKARQASGRPAAEVLDVSPETHLEDMVNDERSQSGDTDLLDEDRPIE